MENIVLNLQFYARPEHNKYAAYRERYYFVKEHHGRHMEVKYKVLKYGLCFLRFRGSLKGFYLIVVRAICRFFNRSPLLGISNLDADDGIHIEPGKLPGLDDGDADLVVLGLEGVVPRARGLGPKRKLM